MNTTNIRAQLVNNNMQIKIFQRLRTISLISIIILLNACSTISSYNEVNKNTRLTMSQQEMSSAQLLNVSIEIFEPGVMPKDKDEKRGLSKEIRNFASFPINFSWHCVG